MATIEPFKGIRYNMEKITDLSTVIAPPYDIINQSGQDAYYNQDPYNIIRLEYGKEEIGDSPANNRYTRARDTFNRWLEQKILLRESQPVFYLYRQSFTYRGTSYQRDGIIAALKVEPYGKGAILPHEETLTKPKADRLELFRSCRANFSPIFTLFPDRENQVERIYAPLLERPPLAGFSDQQGESHRLWAITSPARQRALQEYIAPRSLLIADGHHRYETSLRFSEEAGARRGRGYRYALTIMTSLHSPGLLMLPTHRLLNGLSPRQAGTLLKIASRYFELQFRDLPQGESSSELFPELREPGREPPALGLILPDRACLLTLKNAPGTPGRLDVSLLQELIVKPLLEETPEGTAERVISYTTDQRELLKAVVTGRAQAGFILSPTPMEEVVVRARRNEKMPQKSTYFFPKLPSGLVIYSLDQSM